MKTLQESIIGRKGGVSIWPNPYNLTKNDAIGYLSKVPLEIISLALKEMEEQYQFTSRSTTSDLLRALQRSGVFACFEWWKTKDGPSFWSQINKGDFDVFYRIYTPTKLKERLEE